MRIAPFTIEPFPENSKERVMFKKVLVPLDGSPFGEHALPLALSIARRAGAGLQLVHVHQPVSTVYVEGAALLDAELEAQLKAEQQSYLDSVARRLVQESSVPIESMFLDGD